MNSANSQTNNSLDGTHTGYFVIADISGYTGFLAQNELVHAQGILAELCDLLIEKLSAPFRFVELEGDAVFVFAPEISVEDSERLVDIIEACYAAFRIRLDQMDTNTSCECSACRNMKDLDLKFVAHFGQYVPQSTPTGTKLVGSDVILVHRLLKNSVIQKIGINAYALLTEAFISKALFGEGGLGLPRHKEEYPELGEIEARVLDLTSSLDRYREAARCCIEPEDADLLVVSELPAPRSMVWSYFVDAKRRRQWQTDARSVENHAPPGGRTGVGLESHCDHGSYRMNHRIIDWQPFDYISMDTISTGKSPAKPPSGQVTFALQDLPGGHCKISMRMRANDRGIVTKFKLGLMGWLPKKQWQDHYRALARILRDDLEKSKAASEPIGDPPANLTARDK